MSDVCSLNHLVYSSQHTTTKEMNQDENKNIHNNEETTSHRKRDKFIASNTAPSPMSCRNVKIKSENWNDDCMQTNLMPSSQEFPIPTIQKSVSLCRNVSSSVNETSSLNNSQTDYNTRLQDMLKMADDLGFGRNSTETVLFFLSEILHENGLQRAEISALSKEIRSLRAQIGKMCEQVSEPEELTTPVFSTMAAYHDVENYPKFLLRWMKKQGGSDLRDHIRRVLGQLLSPKLQRRINRTGANGKAKFNEKLERYLKRSCLSLYSNTTEKDVEQGIMKFLNGSRDRYGGREKRRCLRLQETLDTQSSQTI